MKGNERFFLENQRIPPFNVQVVNERQDAIPSDVWAPFVQKLRLVVNGKEFHRVRQTQLDSMQHDMPAHSLISFTVEPSEFGIRAAWFSPGNHKIALQGTTNGLSIQSVAFSSDNFKVVPIGRMPFTTPQPAPLQIMIESKKHDFLRGEDIELLVTIHNTSRKRGVLFFPSDKPLELQRRGLRELFAFFPAEDAPHVEIMAMPPYGYMMRSITIKNSLDLLPGSYRFFLLYFTTVSQNIAWAPETADDLFDLGLGTPVKSESMQITVGK